MSDYNAGLGASGNRVISLTPQRGHLIPQEFIFTARKQNDETEFVILLGDEFFLVVL
jgi:hypothetical protein